jgi:hypothetical protein
MTDPLSQSGSEPWMPRVRRELFAAPQVFDHLPTFQRVLEAWVAFEREIQEALDADEAMLTDPYLHELIAQTRRKLDGLPVDALRLARLRRTRDSSRDSGSE